MVRYKVVSVEYDKSKSGCFHTLYKVELDPVVEMS